MTFDECEFSKVLNLRFYTERDTQMRCDLRASTATTSLLSWERLSNLNRRLFLARLCSSSRPHSKLTLFSSYRSLICFAIVMNACSTLVAFFAEVSKKGIDSWLAKSYRLSQSYIGGLEVHHLLLDQVALIAHQELIDPLGRVPVNLLKPLLDVIESFLVSDVVDYDDAVGASVVRRRDRSESLLSSRIPLCQPMRYNLQLDRLSFQLDRSDFLSRQT